MKDGQDTFEAADLAPTSEGVGSMAPEAGVMGRIVDKAGYLFAAGIVAAAIILLMEVFLRYVFNSPTIWAHETTVFLCGIAFTFGGLYCTCRNSHIRVVLLYDLFPPRVRRIADVLISLVCAVASAFFAYAAYHMVERAVFAPSGEIRLETTGSAWSAPTPALIKVFIFVIMILLVLQFLILAFNYARKRPGSPR
ncbi:TRAP transporter small permease [Chelativorans sp. AA-79]|uniref:TRAP transporter small permease subunit n=1 Tax=Chelativorans sp. AA-79 TaxID=3028735 RepID=UPI0023F8411D|nr:TRAP transporter small permease [Chelativorans sp. AA-79]WEX10995.1 TRAP transporter small permease [Chelativorans sp. AA-79]